MPIGFGSIYGMIHRLRENNKMLRRSSRFDQNKSGYRSRYDFLNNSDTRFEPKNKTEEERQDFTRKMNRQRKIEYVKILALLILAFSALTVLFFKIIPDTNTGYYNEAIDRKNRIETQNQYRYLIIDGDRWVKKKKWHNAIFQYEHALKLMPGNSIAEKRLAFAYLYRCEFENKECDQAIRFVSKLTEKQPWDADLYLVKARYYQHLGDTLSAEENYRIIDRLDRISNAPAK